MQQIHPGGAQVAIESKKLFRDIKSGESFSYIIAKSAKLLKSDGCCSFVVPESILNIKAHKDIRKFILNNFSIREITLLGKIFSGVLTGVVILKLEKSGQDRVLMTTIDSVSEIEQKIFEEDENYNFTILKRQDAEILSKIYSISHSTLQNSRWGLGIETGNNKKHVISKVDGAEKIYTGKEIGKYILKPTEKYIYYTPKIFQQCTPEDLYRSPEKLVYKFISKSPI